MCSYLEQFGPTPKDIRFGRIHKGKYTCAFVDFYNQQDMKRALIGIDCDDAPMLLGRVVDIDINEGAINRTLAVAFTKEHAEHRDHLKSKRMERNENQSMNQDVRWKREGGSMQGADDGDWQQFDRFGNRRSGKRKKGGNSYFRGVYIPQFVISEVVIERGSLSEGVCARMSAEGF